VDSLRGDSVRVSVGELVAAATFEDLTATTTVQLQGAVFCPAIGRWGDLDRDGLANSRDALAVLSDAVDLPVPGGFDILLGDVDGDGLANTRDALILLSYAVGLDIPGQRVLVVAAGPCAAGAVPDVAVLPDTADLVAGQSIGLLAFARDGAGHLTAISGLQWQTLDPLVALVDAGGLLVARQPGSTRVVAALGPGKDIEVPVIVRARRGTWYADAQRAAQNPVQLGTQTWPFDNPGRAFEWVSPEDTIRLAPGVYDFTQGYSAIGAGIVVLGDTLPDGTRPLLRYTSGGSSTGLTFQLASEYDARAGATGPAGAPQAGAGGVEVRNVAIQGFYQAIETYGVRTLLLDNVRIDGRGIYYAYGLVVQQPMDTLRVRRSEFRADSAEGGYSAIRGFDGGGLVEIHDSRVWYWDSDAAVYLTDVDSLDVRRTDFFRNYRDIDLSTSDRYSVSAVLERNRFEESNDGTVTVDGARTVVLDHNIHRARYTGIEVGGPSSGSLPAAPGSRLILRGDSIELLNAGYWFNAWELDSVLVDSLWFSGRADSARFTQSSIEANYARVTDSRILNLYSQGIYFTGARLVVDNTEFRGCGVCDWNSTTALYVTEDEDGGTAGGVAVSNSTFFNLSRAVEQGAGGTLPGSAVLSNNQVDSVAYGFDVVADSVAMTDNVLTRILYVGIAVEPSNAGTPGAEAQLQRNQVSCHQALGTSGYGIQVYYNPARLDFNAVRDCQYGVYASQYFLYPPVNVTSRGDTVFPRSVASYHAGMYFDGLVRPTVSRARIVGGYVGIDVHPYDTTTVVRIDSSAVSGAGFAGIQLYSVPGSASGIRNNIAGNQYGIYDYGPGPRSFTLGKFSSGGTGNSAYAVLSGYAFDATQNWWGSPNGAGGTYGSGLADADSVSSASVNVTSPLTAEPGDVPPLAPPGWSGASGAGARSSPPAASAGPTAPQAPQPPEARRAARAERARELRAARDAWQHDRARRRAAERPAAPTLNRPR
jgi:hypothetical protein